MTMQRLTRYSGVIKAFDSFLIDYFFHSFNNYAHNHPYIPVPNVKTKFKEGLLYGLAIMVLD